MRLHAQRWTLAAAFAVAAAGCGHGGAPRAKAPKPLLADPGGPLRVVDRPLARGPARVSLQDVSFSGRRGRVYAYLAVPAKVHGRVPSVIVLHGAGGTRRDFLPYAVTLARRGFAALTLTAPSSRSPIPSGLGPRATLHREAALAADDVVAVRRAVDFLRTRRVVAPSRIGLVGWSAGARTGAVVAGVEPRIRAFVLMSAGAVPVSAYVNAVPPWLRPDVRTTLGRIDPLRWIAKARPGAVFLEDGRRDEVVPRRALVAIVRAAPPRTRVRWYDAPHRLDSAAVRDGLVWLGRRLATTRS